MAQFRIGSRVKKRVGRDPRVWIVTRVYNDPIAPEYDLTQEVGRGERGEVLQRVPEVGLKLA